MKVVVEIDMPDHFLVPVFRALVRSVGCITATDAAELVHLSPSRFSAVFREHTGATFRSTRLQIKLETAALLLCATTLRISEVADQVGYRDLRKFRKAFKKHFGMSPFTYRKIRFNNSGARQTVTPGPDSHLVLPDILIDSLERCSRLNGVPLNLKHK
jgi:AraC-like DNA-binding protein